jgi:catechol 2,3-dioxygenase-like lactoylglutathione lyase family enzyme
MAVINALAGIAVTDIAAATAWYRRLLDRGPDEEPMAGLAEWRFDIGGWIQVFEDKDRAGSSSVTFAEDDFEGRLSDLKAKGIPIGPATRSDTIKTAIIKDPDGNQLVFAQGGDHLHRSVR